MYSIPSKSTTANDPPVMGTLDEPVSVSIVKPFFTKKLCKGISQQEIK